MGRKNKREFEANLEAHRRHLIENWITSELIEEAADNAMAAGDDDPSSSEDKISYLRRLGLLTTRRDQQRDTHTPTKDTIARFQRELESGVPEEWNKPAEEPGTENP